LQTRRKPPLIGCFYPAEGRTGRSQWCSRGFRFICADCKRPLASPQTSGKTTPSPENIVLLEFEAAFGAALKNERNLRFPGASIGPKYFLQMVEDLFWLLTRKTAGYGRLFVHHLHRTVFRISQRLYYLPQSRPWLGDFDARNRPELLSHIAALAGGRSIRERLLLFSARRCSGMTEALTWLRSSDRRNYPPRRSSTWECRSPTALTRTCYWHCSRMCWLAEVRHGTNAKPPKSFRISSGGRAVCTTF
jgi:hypothetical protein